MSATLLDGKALSFKIKEELKEQCKELKNEYLLVPKLAIVLVGDNPASLVYVSSKEKACAEVGIQSVVVRLKETVTEECVISEVDKLAQDKTVNAVMVQLPLPKDINERNVLAHIPPEKDADGLTALSAGKMFDGEFSLLPCTPSGIIELLKRNNIELCGKHAVIVGRSNLVGKPLSILLLRENCTVTVCHSKTQDLSKFTSSADILVVAIGKKNFVTGNMVKQGAVVIDVGINRTAQGLFGDVDFNAAKEVASYITPVPGGVGPMTVTMLLSNAILACKMQNSILKK